MIKIKQTAVLSLGVVVAGAMVLLGMWQASTFRTQGQQATIERAQLAPVDLPPVADGETVAGLYGRPITVTGQYLPEFQYYVGSTPPLRVVTAFKTSAGQVVPIVRGQVAAGQTPSPAPAGTVTQSGLVLPSEKDFHGVLAQGLPEPVIATVKLERLAQDWPAPLLNGFITLSEADSAAQSMTPADVVLPEGEGSQRNAGYALQWWVFAAFGLAMSVVWARQIGKPVRDEKHAARARAVAQARARAAATSSTGDGS